MADVTVSATAAATAATPPEEAGGHVNQFAFNRHSCPGPISFLSLHLPFFPPVIMPSQVAVGRELERERESQMLYTAPPQVAAAYRAPYPPYGYMNPHEQRYPAHYSPWPAHDPVAQPPMQAHPPQPVQPVAHKVWLLDCRTCGNFLTNRGMKVRNRRSHR